MKKKVLIITCALLLSGSVAGGQDRPAAHPNTPPGGMMPWMMPGGGPQGSGPMGRSGGMYNAPMMGGGMNYGTPMMGGGAMMAPGQFGYGPGLMMGQGMMRFGMGPGMIRGLGAMGYVGKEEFQKFFDETREMRRELHGLMFDYAELLRQPKVDRKKRIELENKIQSLRQQVYAKAPRYQYWPY